MLLADMLKAASGGKSCKCKRHSLNELHGCVVDMMVMTRAEYLETPCRPYSARLRTQACSTSPQLTGLLAYRVVENRTCCLRT